MPAPCLAFVVDVVVHTLRPYMVQSNSWIIIRGTRLLDIELVRLASQFYRVQALLATLQTKNSRNEGDSNSQTLLCNPLTAQTKRSRLCPEGLNVWPSFTQNINHALWKIWYWISTKKKPTTFQHWWNLQCIWIAINNVCTRRYQYMIPSCYQNFKTRKTQKVQVSLVKCIWNGNVDLSSILSKKKMPNFWIFN